MILSKIFRFIWLTRVHTSAIAVGGALGAVMRYAICGFIDNQILAVLICNIFGTFILSVTLALKPKLHPDISNLIASGFCGGISIFASFSKDSVLALRAQDYGLFFMNFATNFLICIFAVFVADYIVEHFTQFQSKVKQFLLIFKLNKKKSNLDKLEQKATQQKISEVTDKVAQAAESLGIEVNPNQASQKTVDDNANLENTGNPTSDNSSSAPVSSTSTLKPDVIAKNLTAAINAIKNPLPQSSKDSDEQITQKKEQATKVITAAKEAISNIAQTAQISAQKAQVAAQKAQQAQAIAESDAQKAQADAQKAAEDASLKAQAAVRVAEFSSQSHDESLTPKIIEAVKNAETVAQTAKENAQLAEENAAKKAEDVVKATKIKVVQSVEAAASEAIAQTAKKVAENTQNITPDSQAIKAVESSENNQNKDSKSISDLTNPDPTASTLSSNSQSKSSEQDNESSPTDKGAK